MGEISEPFSCRSGAAGSAPYPALPSSSRLTRTALSIFQHLLGTKATKSMEDTAPCLPSPYPLKQWARKASQQKTRQILSTELSIYSIRC